MSFIFGLFKVQLMVLDLALGKINFLFNRISFRGRLFILSGFQISQKIEEKLLKMILKRGLK